jgi:hypothetical protein
MADSPIRVGMSRGNPELQETTGPEVTQVSSKEINNPDLNPEQNLEVNHLRTTNWFIFKIAFASKGHALN